MHLLATTSTTLDEIVEPVDLGQPPGDMLVLSFADSDLAGLAAAWALERDALPSVRLAHLRDLRHPMSVDLWLERVARPCQGHRGAPARRARLVALRCRAALRACARARHRAGALPGEDREDPRLAQASTLSRSELDALLCFFREGGPENLRALLRRLARYAGARVDAPEPRAIPRMAGYLPGYGAIELDRLVGKHPSRAGRWCRSSFIARCCSRPTRRAIDALCEALASKGLAPAPLFITNFKDPAAAEFVRRALKRLSPAVDPDDDGLRARRRNRKADRARWT